MDSSVSVITPCFNSAQTIGRAHESLLDQQCQCQWQHVIIDDGSSDASWSVIETLRRDPRVVATRTPENRGAGAALNTGVELAQGDFIAFLDADDEYLPDHLGSHLAAMQEAPDLDVLWGGIEVVTSRAEDLLVPDVGRGFGLIPITECVVQGTIFARRRVFESLRFIEGAGMWFQDYDFIQRAGREFRTARFSHPTYRYYRNSGTSTVDRMKATWPVEGIAWKAGSV